MAAVLLVAEPECAVRRLTAGSLEAACIALGAVLGELTDESTGSDTGA